MSSKRVLFVISCMNGGGAERVVSLLAGQMQKNGIDANILVTNQPLTKVYRGGLDKSVKVLSLEDMLSGTKPYTKIYYALSGIKSRIVCGLSEKSGGKVSEKNAYKSFMWQNYNRVDALRNYLSANPDMTVIAFLQPSIPLVMLAAQGLPNKIIFSERGNPQRLMKGRYGYDFVARYYQRADVAVFQSEGAMEAYPSDIQKKGTIIFNPISANLPDVYIGERKKTVVNFCRISKEKNLPLLLDAFESFYKKHPDYRLEIIGDACNPTEEELKDRIGNFIKEKGLTHSVSILPFMGDIHEYIKDLAMFVSSSDYEGMSNSMLEAMALGLPSICTDCPSGGAKAVIKDGKNGLLVPVGDAEALCNAMCRVAEERELAKGISYEGSKLRESLKLENIARQWIDLL